MKFFQYGQQLLLRTGGNQTKTSKTVRTDERGGSVYSDVTESHRLLLQTEIGFQSQELIR